MSLTQLLEKRNATQLSFASPIIGIKVMSNANNANRNCDCNCDCKCTTDNCACECACECN